MEPRDRRQEAARARSHEIKSVQEGRSTSPTASGEEAVTLSTEEPVVDRVPRQIEAENWVKPWDRIAVAERFYSRLYEISKREGHRAVYETDLTLYAEDFPDKVSIHDGESVRERIKVLDEWDQHFADWRETQGKLRARGRSEDQAMIEGHWDEWFQSRSRRRT